MKKLNIFLCFILGLIAFSSCDEDRDSNPTYQKPTTFDLNTPKYVNAEYDLADARAIMLTCSQPDYGFAAPVVYTVEIATKEDFSDYAILPTAYTTARMEVSAKEMAVAIVPLLGVETKEDFPTSAFPVYVRLKASISDAPEGNEIRSNVITLPKVKSYFALEDMKLPQALYAIGDFCEWNWDKATSMIPVNGNPDKFWAMIWCEQGKGLKFNTATSWNGSQFGVADNVTINGIGFDKSDDGNIVFKESSWHLVMITVAINGRSYDYTVDFMEPAIYVFGVANGGAFAADDKWKFAVPTKGDGEFVSPALAADSAGDGDDCLRVCVVLSPNIDWWRSEFIFFDGKIAYRGNGGDQDRIGCKKGQKVYLDFSKGTGRCE
ncbi:SusF/SusE family outer membrane protein [Bacteroides sp.]|uniref:SusF/SusE family outer membrane protein n=1 Tax=Bacteroides sp. TaxID=29523 RepID=UPI002626F67D|nr:SusF/SusE family outer membrane protein [Bacteroides sp.]